LQPAQGGAAVIAVSMGDGEFAAGHGRIVSGCRGMLSWRVRGKTTAY
jgi:hypothetical protein